MLYIGTITIPNGAARNNIDTAVPFDIPACAVALRFQPAANDLLFGFGLGDSFAVSATTGANLGSASANVPSQAFRLGYLPKLVVSFRNQGGAPASVKVYAVPA